MAAAFFLFLQLLLNYNEKKGKGESMGKKKKTSYRGATKTEKMPRALKSLLLIGGGLLMFLGLFSYRDGAPYSNWLGLLGYSISRGLVYLTGMMSLAIPTALMWVGLRLTRERPLVRPKIKSIAFLGLVLSVCVLLSVLSYQKPQLGSAFGLWLWRDRLPYGTIYLGGVPLYRLYVDLFPYGLLHLLGAVGTTLIFSATAIAMGFILFNGSLFTLINQMRSLWSKIPFSKLKNLLPKRTPKEEKKERETYSRPSRSKTPALRPTYTIADPTSLEIPDEEPEEPTTKRTAALKAQSVINGDLTHYKLPSANGLTPGKKRDQTELRQELQKMAAVLEETLLSFGIEAKVGDIHCGPTITLFEVHPAVGVKVQKIKTLSNDIALNMQARSIRIIAPIPGKAAVGIEVPNPYPEEVSFRDMLETYQKGKKKFHVPLLLGKMVGGGDVWSDLAKMPHCIIAGATGSGKSVCINTIVMSIVMNAKPDEIKLLMVDPKKVELTAYSKLPHMLAPVITEPQGASNALNWCVKEMERRYEILRQLGIRNIHSFNTRKPKCEEEEALKIEVPEKMPYIVVIIDELADLMMISSSEIETPIARIAQMARAVGIHLILATQRPSREVITGLIKANFPCRIAFKVASRINSQIIIDETGAENLLGNGDMLFLPPGSSSLIRTQGAYICDEDLNGVIDSISKQLPPNYLIPSFDDYEEAPDEANAEASDALYTQAKELVMHTGSASTTFLQRKLKIGYARAASLIDLLEQQRIIGPAEGAKPRKVLQKSLDD